MSPILDAPCKTSLYFESSLAANLSYSASANAGSGNQTDALSIGGGPGVATTAIYDGTSWSSNPSLATGRSGSGGAGSSSTDSMVFGGSQPGNTAVTEEFAGTAAVQTLTTS